jgi:hypothetical protein
MKLASARGTLIALFGIAALAALYLTQRTDPGTESAEGFSLPSISFVSSTPELLQFRSNLEAAGLAPEHAQHISERFEPARREFVGEAKRLRSTPEEGAERAVVAARDRLAARLQAELGPLDYDWALYANAQANRVAVAAVSSDTASASGLRAGDLIFSYAGQRIFTPHDLRRARGRSAAHGPIAARVVRGTLWIDLELPGDSLEALGVRLETRRERPGEPIPTGLGGLARHGS